MKGYLSLAILLLFFCVGPLGESPLHSTQLKQSALWPTTGISFKELKEKASSLCHSSAIQIKACAAGADALLKYAGKAEIYSHLSESELARTDFAATFATLFKKFIRPELEAEAVAASFNGWIRHLDPHGRILPAAYESAHAQNNTIDFVGLGLDYAPWKNSFIVTALTANGPAVAAGLQVGDEILRIDGQLPGTAYEYKPQIAKLLIRRNGMQQLVDVQRKRIFQKNIEWRTYSTDAGAIAYIKVHSFNKLHVCDELAAILRDVQRKHYTRIVLDLRNNPGGYVNEALCTAGLFLGEGVEVARFRSLPAKPLLWKVRTQHNDFILHTNRPQLTKLPLEIRINQNSASAAEILAAALQYHKRAQIRGVQSFGKGSMQQYRSIEENPRIVLAVTSHEIVAPSGKSLQYNGVTPDIFEENTQDQKKALRERDFYPAIY
jgi:carboxyl-terminal processing protease